MGNMCDRYRTNFRENLKSFRLNHGFTQSELSLKANYDSTYVGKLERGSSAPSVETIIRLGNILEINPLKLLRPSRAHLDISEEISSSELQDLPYNPLDIQIFDSLPFAMGIITDLGTPVYVNDSFVNLTGIRRDEIKEIKLWELPFWEFANFCPEQIIESIKRVYHEESTVHYELKNGQSAEPPLDLFFYPTPIDYKPGERMMWIFEIRHPNHKEIDFPLTISSVKKVQ